MHIRVDLERDLRSMKGPAKGTFAYDVFHLCYDAVL